MTRSKYRSPRATRPSPTSAETTERTNASAKSWVTIRPREAPSAARTAISLVRVTVRAYTRTATLRQTTTRSREIMACSIAISQVSPSAWAKTSV